MPFGVTMQIIVAPRTSYHPAPRAKLVTPAGPSYIGRMLPPFDEIKSNFELLDEGNDQFEYLMELGRMLPPLPPEKHTDDRLVPGCQSRVWLDMTRVGDGSDATLELEADSDALITKGLVAFLVALYSGERADTIRNTDAIALFRDLGLGQHVTSKRANGLRSMAERIQREAQDMA